MQQNILAKLYVPMSSAKKFCKTQEIPTAATHNVANILLFWTIFNSIKFLQTSFERHNK